jgi:hypothetical protein
LVFDERGFTHFSKVEKVLELVFEELGFVVVEDDEVEGVTEGFEEWVELRWRGEWRDGGLIICLWWEIELWGEFLVSDFLEQIQQLIKYLKPLIFHTNKKLLNPNQIPQVISNLQLGLVRIVLPHLRPHGHLQQVDAKSFTTNKSRRWNEVWQERRFETVIVLWLLV